MGGCVVSRAVAPSDSFTCAVTTFTPEKEQEQPTATVVDKEGNAPQTIEVSSNLPIPDNIADDLKTSSPSAKRLPTLTLEEQLRRVLGGDFAFLKSTGLNSSIFKLLVFVSSTFTDTGLERDFLMDRLQFDLRAMANEHQIQVILVDMRWGVRDENSCDHRTWVECADMLHWCKEESNGIAFLSLQSGKLGYTPLPLSIRREMLMLHLAKTECPEQKKEQIFQWYVLDENAVPEQYVLKTLTDKDDKEYWAAFEALHAALQGIAFDEEHPSLQVGGSVTSYEVSAAFDGSPVQLTDRDKSFLWSHRQLSGEVTDKQYCDGKAGSVKEVCLTELKLFMSEQFPLSTIQEYAPIALSDLQASEEDNNEKKRVYMEQSESFLRTRLTHSLQLIIAEKQRWETDGNGLGYRGAALSEALHHSGWAHEKCFTFCGRTVLVSTALAAILMPHRDADFKGKYPGINVGIVGVSGSG
jgi:hypothetical protein